MICDCGAVRSAVYHYCPECGRSFDSVASSVKWMRLEDFDDTLGYDVDAYLKFLDEPW